jgi:NitT/TauT family transport system permease protein
MSSAVRTVGAPKARRGRSRTFTRKQRIIVTVINLAIFCALWQILATAADIPRIFLPKLTEVFEQYPKMIEEGIFFSNVWISLRIYLIGMAVSIAIGVPLGLLVGGIKVLDKVLLPYLWVIYTTPLIILMPLILLWVGINDRARVLLIVVSAVPAIVVIVMEGVKTVEPSLLRAARSFGAKRSVLFAKVIMPSTIPFIATGVKMGVSRGLIGLFVGELFTSATGIGYIITLASKVFNIPRVFAMLLMFVVFSVAMVGLAQYIERRLSVWRSSAAL